jgi:MATE family multidrug resistance protein
MRNAMLSAAIVFALLAAALRPLGNHGLWLAFLGFMLVRGAIMGAMAWRIGHGTGGWLANGSPA